MAGKTSRNGKGYYATYKAANIFSKNKEKKLKRHLKDYPEDKQAQEALKTPQVWGRKTPKTRKWSAAEKWMAQLEAQFRRYANAVANGQFEKPEPDPRYMNYGMEIAVSPEAKSATTTKKKRSRKPKAKKEAA